MRNTDDIEGVYLMDPTGRSPSLRLPLGEGISGRVISTGEPLLIPDVEQVEKLRRADLRRGPAAFHRGRAGQ